MPVFVFATGLAAGVAHAVTGPDHLVAVGPIALRHRRRAWRTGFLWGVGHGVGVGVLAALAWLVRERFPLDDISAFSERTVGVVLIAVGLWALRTVLRRRVHSHEHTHGGETHAHVHVHGACTKHEEATAHDHSHAAAGIGALHGFAGTAHLVGVLPAVAMSQRAEVLAYVAGYAAGSVVAMTVFTTVLGEIGARASKRPGRVLRVLELTAAALAILVGSYWLAGA